MWKDSSERLYVSLPIEMEASVSVTPLHGLFVFISSQDTSSTVCYIHSNVYNKNTLKSESFFNPLVCFTYWLYLNYDVYECNNTVQNVNHFMSVN